MAVQYLFDSRGNWIAFSEDGFVFNTHGKWLGWIPWGDGDVVTRQGKYLGSIVDGGRFYFFRSHPCPASSSYPSHPGYPSYPGYPGYSGYSPLPPGAQDLEGLDDT